jgi:hypothetical protein
MLQSPWKYREASDFQERKEIMTESIIISLLSMLGTAVGAFGGFRLTAYRIEQLEKKVEKQSVCVNKLPVLEEKISVANHRITDLETAFASKR